MDVHVRAAAKKRGLAGRRKRHTVRGEGEAGPRGYERCKPGEINNDRPVYADGGLMNVKACDVAWWEVGDRHRDVKGAGRRRCNW